MNERSDIERVLRLWMADPPATMPDRVVDVVAARIAVNRQRRVVRFPGRKAAMPSRTLSLLVGAAAVVAVAVAAIYLISRPSSADVGGPTPAPSATAAPSSPASPRADTSAAPWWNSQGRGAGQLATGTHTSTYLQPTLTYTVGAGWVNDYDNADAYELLPDTAAERALLEGGGQTAYYLSINRNMRIGSTDCSADPQGGFSPDDIVNALATRPGLAVTAPVSATVGGLSGKQVDLAVADGWSGTCPQSAGLPAVATFTNGEANWWAVAGERKRVIVLANPQAGNLLIEIAGPTDGFDGFLGQAMAIVNSFRFGVAP
jgi:hypothetical protein